MKYTLAHIGLSLFVTWMIAMTIWIWLGIPIIAIITGSVITLCAGIYKEAVKDEMFSWWDMGCNIFGIGLGDLIFMICV
jgi:uncharacterized membrane protein YgaE (UPF0421/DUF939 family)